MSEELENQLRKAFASEQANPSEGHEARFALRIAKGGPSKSGNTAKRLYWAAAAVLSGAVLWVALPRTDAPRERATADTNKAVRVAESQFAEHPTNSAYVFDHDHDPIATELLQRLDTLEKEYENLRPALQASPDKPELVEAALTNLRYRTDVMIRLQQYLQLKSIQNKNENEKNSHS